MRRNRPRITVCSLLFVSLSAPCIMAQEGIVWPMVKPAPDAIVVRLSDKNYDVYFPGFATVASALDPDEEVGGGLGIIQGQVRQVDESEFVNEAEGEEMDVPLFSFKLDLKVGMAFDTLTRGLNLAWTGFKAKPSGKVPALQSGAFCMKFRLVSPVSLATLMGQLRGSVVGVGVVDSSGNLLNNKRLFLLKVVNVVQAGAMYYKFERGVGDLALNYVDQFAGAPPSGGLSTSKNPFWTVGKFGGALRGGTSSAHSNCDTGWHGGAYGNLTLAWFMKQRNAPGTATSRIFAGPGALRCFTNGAAGKGIRCAGWAGNAVALRLNVDVQTLSANKWVHIALVINGGAGRAVWYVDGKAQPAINIARVPHIPLVTGSLVLGGEASDANVYDIDEFRLGGMATPASMIMKWATMASPATASYGASTGCLLRHKNGPPRVGNSSYELWVVGPGKSPFALVLGAPRHPPLAFANGLVYVSFPELLLVLGTIGDDWRAKLPLGIPNLAFLRGLTVHSQAYVAPQGKNSAISNALAISIE